MFLFLFCFLLSTTLARLPMGMSYLELSYDLKVLPPRFWQYFVAFFLRLVAPCVSLWVGGAPLAVFSLPLPLWRFFPLGGWVPLAVFSPCFPPVSWVRGGAILSILFFSPAISCILHLVLFKGRVGQHGLPTRKPPGPPHPVPWRVCPYPSPAGS